MPRIWLSALVFLATGCALFHNENSASPSSANGKITPRISQSSILPGSRVRAGSQELPLYNGSLKVGDNFIAKAGMIGFKFSNRVTVVNLVPSIDTQVCDQQAHLLSQSKTLSPKVERVLISRDLPMAQKRFASTAHLENITYYSDYKDGGFGRQNGLMMKGPELLTRGVIVLDKQGIVRYMHLVSNLGELPDMEKSFLMANQLAEQKK